MHASKSQAKASSPPPINWATKPKPSQNRLSIHPQDNTDDPSAPARRLVPVFIDTDRIGDLQELLHHLGGSVGQQPKPEFRDNAVINARSIEEVSARFNQLEVNSGRSQPEFQDTARLCLDGRNPASQVPDVMAPTSSHLATQRNSVPRNTFAVRTDSPSPPGPNSPIAVRTPPNITPQVSPTKQKYYVILVGKCAGIYYGEW